MKKLYKLIAAFAFFASAFADAQISQPIGPGGRPATFTNHGVLIGQGASNVVASTAGTAGLCLISNGAGADPTYQSCSTGSGTVTSVSVVSTNGFTGSVATPTTTPAITLTTSANGVLKGNGTAISAATSGTDYSPGTSGNATGIVKSTTGTGVLTTAVAGDFPTLNQNTTGTASNVTGIVGIANGGTALSSIPANGALDIGNGTNFTRTTLTAGTGISVANGIGTITISASGSTGAPTYLWGDCSDGNVTVASGVTTLNRDMFYNNLTINGTGSIKTNGYRVFVCNTLDLSAAPASSLVFSGTIGNAGVGQTQGTGVTGTGPGNIGGVPASGAGGAGGAIATNGNPGTASSPIGTYSNGGGVTQNSGNGGNAPSGGPNGGAGTVTATEPYAGAAYPLSPSGMVMTGATFNLPNGGLSGSGGGGGSGGGAAVGGGGGSGGTGGGVMAIAANVIARGSNATANIITVRGGTGGAGGIGGSNSGGGGGGSGAGGGWLILSYNTLTGSSIAKAIELTAGSGGTGGNGAGTGIGGNGGGSGNSGIAHVFNITTGVLTVTPTVAGTAGTAGAGTVGGAGAIASAQQINL